MRTICVGAAQFEHRDGDKEQNLASIRRLAHAAADQGAEIVAFHECCVTGYTFLQTLTPGELEALAEPAPGGPTVKALESIARECGLVVMAGLVEKDSDGGIYNCYVTVGPQGYLTKFRKLHPFIHPALRPGQGYHVADVAGIRAGFLICYDNNLPENVRATTLLGAEVIFMPHVTGCTPSHMVGRGIVDPALWENRQNDPEALRREFTGPKGLGWLMRWVPARAWENGVYAIFSNCVGMDGGTIKPGLAMILDPDGEVLAQSTALGEDVVVATLTEEKLARCSAQRYLQARRPELYGPLVKPHPPGVKPVTVPGWRVDK